MLFVFKLFASLWYGASCVNSRFVHKSFFCPILYSERIVFPGHILYLLVAKSVKNLFFKDLNKHQSKMSSSKEIDLYRDLAAVVWGLLPSKVFWGSLLQFCTLWIWSDPEMLNSWGKWSPTGHLLPATNSTLTQGRERGESWTREKVREATVYKAGSKIPTWLTVSINSDKHLPQSPFKGRFFLDDDVLLWCLYN